MPESAFPCALSFKMLTMPQRLLGAAIKPLSETADTSRMAAIREPGLPHKFVWGGETVTVQAVLRGSGLGSGYGNWMIRPS